MLLTNRSVSSISIVTTKERHSGRFALHSSLWQCCLPAAHLSYRGLYLLSQFFPKAKASTGSKYVVTNLGGKKIKLRNQEKKSQLLPLLISYLIQIS